MSEIRPLDDEPKKISSWADDLPYHAFRVYLDFLQETFEGFEGDLLKYRYSRDPQATKLNISGPPPIEAARVANIPAIVVDNPGISALGTVVGDISGRQLLTGQKTYIDYYAGAFPVYIICDTKRTAISIAWLVTQTTSTLRDVLIGNGRFHAIGRSQTGPPSPVGNLVTGKPATPLVSVPVIVPFVLVYKSSVTRINKPKLEGVDVVMRTSAPRARTPTAPVGWRVEDWVRTVNQARGYRTPTDPLSVPALPTETVDARESEGEVVVDVDIVD